MRVASLFPHYGDAVGNSHTALSVCGNMRGERLELRMFQPASVPAARKPFTRDAVPRFLKGVVYRIVGAAEPLNRYCERHFLRRIHSDEAAYLWPGVEFPVFEQIKERGHLLVIERINCHTGTAKRILDDAYARIGMPPTHGVTDAMVERERDEFAIADFAFAPSPLVEQSMLDNGVPESKILPCSYGWDPERLTGVSRALAPIEGLTVLFVGSVNIRKGAHLLIEAWIKSGVKGRLVFAGEPSLEITKLCAQQLTRPDINSLGWVWNVPEVFRSADVFAFPTLEEGGPLVTYEAMACRLPVIVSPMGAGRIARHNLDGFVIDPYDTDAWADAIRRLAQDKELRKSTGANARCRAEEFTWEKAGAVRRERLLAALAARGGRR